MGDSGQLTSSAAEVHDEFFVPALFAVWAPRLVAAAQRRPGARVVDVACGTGVLAIAAAKVTAPGGEVVGVDLNAGMLAVARRKAADVDWQRAPAEAHFPSIRSWMHTDVRGWTLGDEIDDTQYERLVSEAERELDRFVIADGTVQFAQPGLIATATKP